MQKRDWEWRYGIDGVWNEPWKNFKKNREKEEHRGNRSREREREWWARNVRWAAGIRVANWG